MKKGVKSSSLPRSLQLLGMASAVVGKELTQNVKDRFQRGVDDLASGRLKTRIEQAKVIADNLSQLKGAAMKAGQLLSLDAADYFPPEAIEILSKLQAGAEPVDFSLIERVLREDLGEDRFARLEQLEKRPAAAASIGQVHRAFVDGREVAVKVQYPGVSEAIDSDLAVLEKLARGLVTVSGRKIELDGLFAELSVVLKAEADYRKELANMQEYASYLEGQDSYVVPRPLAEMSGPRVLTMSWEHGLRVQDWLKTNPPAADREKLGRLVLDLYCQEFYRWGFVQTDPNYGNFLVREFPLRLVVLDFGATLRYDEEFRERYMKLLKALSGGTRDAVIDVTIQMGIIDPRESEESKDLFFELLMNAMEPFDPKLQPFRFTDEDYARRARDIGRRFTNSLKFSPPPKQILFLHRKLGGIFTLLKRMDVRMDLVPYWEQMVGVKPPSR